MVRSYRAVWRAAPRCCRWQEVHHQWASGWLGGRQHLTLWFSVDLKKRETERKRGQKREREGRRRRWKLKNETREARLVFRRDQAATACFNQSVVAEIWRAAWVSGGQPTVGQSHKLSRYITKVKRKPFQLIGGRKRLHANGRNHVREERCRTGFPGQVSALALFPRSLTVTCQGTKTTSQNVHVSVVSEKC